MRIILVIAGMSPIAVGGDKLHAGSGLNVVTMEPEVDLASQEDVAGILDLQRDNLPERGGALSVSFSHDWFAAAIAAMPVIVARKQGTVVGFLVSSPFAAHADVPIVQAMLRAYPAHDDAYLYGPICIAASERGRGLAGTLFTALRRELPGREGVLFIRRDNLPSLQAHAKMGMRQVAEFIHDDAVHVVLAYIG